MLVDDWLGCKVGRSLQASMHGFLPVPLSHSGTCQHGLWLRFATLGSTSYPQVIPTVRETTCSTDKSNHHLPVDNQYIHTLVVTAISAVIEILGEILVVLHMYHLRLLS